MTKNEQYWERASKWLEDVSAWRDAGRPSEGAEELISSACVLLGVGAASIHRLERLEEAIKAMSEAREAAKQ